MSKVVLDTSAVLVFFQNGSGAAEVERALVQALNKPHSIFVSSITWGELRFLLTKEYGQEFALRKLRELEQLGVAVETVGDKLSEAAAVTAIKHGVRYSHCLAVALASSKKATLFTAEKSLRAVPRVYVLASQPKGFSVES